jgi:hypothetical protein
MSPVRVGTTEKTATAALNGRAVFNGRSLRESPRRCKRREVCPVKPSGSI